MNRPVIIVGAGISGLYTASLLSAKGIACKVIESRNRIGGRVLTEEVAGARFDLGPTWFWPEHEPVIAALIRKLGLETFTQHTGGDLLFEQRADSPHQRHALPDHAVQKSERIEGGVQSLIDAIAKTLPDSTIALNTQVTAIEMSQLNEVSVHTVDPDGDHRTFEASSVVLALPPRLLKRMTFSPHLSGLPDLPTWMAGQAKVIAVYDQPFWREQNLSGQTMSWAGPLQEIHDASPVTGPGALFGFFGLSATQRYELGEEKVKEMVIQQLVRLYGENARQPVALLYKDWAMDADTATEEDVLPLTDFPQYHQVEITGRWHGKLLFAGTETSAEAGGHLEGAIRSAERAAHAIIKNN